MGPIYWKLWILSVAIGGTLALAFEWAYPDTDWQLALPAIITVSLILPFVIVRIVGEPKD